MPYSDPEKRKQHARESKRRRYAENPEPQREASLRHYRKQRERAAEDPDLAEALRKQARERMRRWREKNPDKNREAGERSRAKKDYAKAWRQGHRDDALFRDRARARVRYAVKTGRLIPQPCEVCGVEPYRNERRYVQAHHEDYSKPLDVRWLCPRHHGALIRI